jgi:hypothetical protein
LVEQIVGIIKKKENIRHRSEWGYNWQNCIITLEDGTSVWCGGFIPRVREGGKARIFGKWSEKDKKDFRAEKVERYDDKKIHKPQIQTKLTEFKKNESSNLC